MKVRATLFLALALGLGLGTAWLSSRAAEEKQDAKKDLETKAPDTRAQAAESLAAAYTMAKIGRETKSPEMLLAAAHVIGKANFSKLEFRAETSKVTSKTVEGDPLAEAVALIEEAVNFSGDSSEAVKKLAVDIQNDIKERKRGAIPGPQERRGSVEARSDRFDTFEIQFRGREHARIWVHNRSGQGDIDLFVTDLDGRQIAHDSNSAASAHVTFVPHRDNWYRVRVKAYSDSRPIHYHLVTN
jgi:hypothetical protein